MAASVPVPIAMPRSAGARAAASLTPSPTNTAGCPASRSCLMTAALPSGRTPASTSALCDPDLPGDGRRDTLVVAGEQHGAQAEVAQPCHRGGCARPQFVRDRQRGAGVAVPADEDCGPPVAPPRRRQRHGARRAPR